MSEPKGEFDWLFGANHQASPRLLRKIRGLLRLDRSTVAREPDGRGNKEVYIQAFRGPEVHEIVQIRDRHRPGARTTRPGIPVVDLLSTVEVVAGVVEY